MDRGIRAGIMAVFIIQAIMGLVIIMEIFRCRARLGTHRLVIGKVLLIRKIASPRLIVTLLIGERNIAS